MTGHQQILKSRRQQMKPAAIRFELDAPVVPHRRQVEGGLWDALYNPEKALESGQFPVVYVTAEDVRSRPDLRFVKDCQTYVSGPSWTPELVSLGEALATAGASFVGVSAVAECGDLMFHVGGEWRTFL